MRIGMIKVAVATAAYFLIHSVLANDRVKGWAAELAGQRLTVALYRPFYLAQSLALSALLAVDVCRQPGRDVYQADGWRWWLLRGGQAAALGVLVWGVACVGLSYLTGWGSFEPWWLGAVDVPPMPDGQQASPSGDGTMRAAGPLGVTRHPFN